MMMDTGPRAMRAVVAVLGMAICMTGCLSAKMYVDPALPVVTKVDVRPAATPGPVQVMYEFRTKGVVNSAGTKRTAPRVMGVLSQSGLFSDVSTSVVQGGARLTLVIDNVPVTENAVAKGFGTGLTLGLAGSLVTDGYYASATYTDAGKVTKAEAKHALHTTIGAHAAPQGLTAVKPDTAVDTMADQLAWNLLKQLSDQNAFKE